MAQPQKQSASKLHDNPSSSSRKTSKVIRVIITIYRWELYLLLLLIGMACIATLAYRHYFVSPSIEIVDNLGGNIFPSQIISTATSDISFINPCDTPYVGNPSSLIGIKVSSQRKNTRVSIEVAETPFFKRSVSEFVLPQSWTDYIIYPDIVWNYEALRNNVQATPLSVVVQVKVNNLPQQECVRTFSVRSINECLLGYYQLNRKGKPRRFVSTRLLFAAYINEENPQIDKLLREALNTHIVNHFVGYQHDSATVVRQVYALWNVLQRRNFKYSSISHSSLSSNVVFSQRVRTFEDAMQSSQINCVDGSILFASLMKATGIEPILVRIPGHMFVGFYTDSKHSHANYLETTMIGNVNINDYFPEENIDSLVVGLTQNEASHLAFEKSMQYAERKMQKYRTNLMREASGYMFLPISSTVRRHVQPIGK